MNSSQRPFRTNIGFIVNQPIGFSREFPFDMPAYALDGDFDVHKLSGMVTLTRTSGGIQTQAEFSAQTDGACGRCLKPVKLDLHTEFDQLFTFNAETLTEDEELIPHDGYLDFEILVRDYLIMEIPRKPLCNEDCKGLCSVCGQDLNEKPCEHEQAANDQPALHTSSKKHPQKSKTKN